jgi:protein-disulfide isomerase
VEAGDVIWKYIPITIGGFPNGREAALAGECAGAQERFPAMRDLLFEEREAWMAADDAENLFEGYARQAGLDVEAFGACLESDEPHERLDEANRLARDIGVTGTPTFIVQGYPVQGAPPLDAFQEVLRQMVAEARDSAGN